jgi:hypothetical protein
LSGTCWGAFDLCTQSYLYKVAPQPKKLRYIVYTRCLILLCTAMGGLLGAFAVTGIFPTFGSKILSIFWLSAIARAAVVLYMMPKLVDLAVSFGKPPLPPEIDHQTMLRVLASKRGQFYRKEKQAETAAALQQSKIKEMAKEVAHHGGSRRWQTREQPVPAAPVPTIPVTAEKINLRLEHYRQAMSALEEMKTGITYHGIEPNLDRLKLRFGVEQRPGAVTAANTEPLVNHEVEPNLERLKLRFGLERQPSPVLAGSAGGQPLVRHELEDNLERVKVRFSTKPVPAFNADFVTSQRTMARHQLEENLESIRARFSIKRQPGPIKEAAVGHNIIVAQHMAIRRPESKRDVPEIKRDSGLFQNKAGWARYMKDTLGAALRDVPPRQPVPVASREF